MLEENIGCEIKLDDMRVKVKPKHLEHHLVADGHKPLPLH